MRTLWTKGGEIPKIRNLGGPIPFGLCTMLKDKEDKWTEVRSIDNTDKHSKKWIWQRMVKVLTKSLNSFLDPFTKFLVSSSTQSPECLTDFQSFNFANMVLHLETISLFCLSNFTNSANSYVTYKHIHMQNFPLWISKVNQGNVSNIIEPTRF